MLLGLQNEKITDAMLVVLQSFLDQVIHYRCFQATCIENVSIPVFDSELENSTLFSFISAFFHTLIHTIPLRKYCTGSTDVRQIVIFLYLL